MDAIVERARRNQQPIGLDPEYDVVREGFDHLTYLLQIKDLQTLPQVDPIAHFMAEGELSVNSPDVNFGMQSYLARHPRRRGGPDRTPYAAWRREGRAAGEIADPAYGVKDMAPILGLTPAELVDRLAELRTDLTERIRYGALGEQIAKATELEPLLGGVWASTVHPRIQPLSSPEITRQTVALHACQEQTGFARARIVFVINRPRWGSGRRIEGHVVHALADRIDPSEVVVVYTDESGTTPEGRFPAGVREVDFAAATRGMSPAHAARTLVELLRSFRADAILDINSRVLYDALGPYGKALAASERVFPVMFCNEQLSQGNWAGWSLKHYYRVNEIVPGIITDSEYLKNELTERHLLSEADRAKLHVFQAPVQPEIPVADAPVSTPGRRPKVYWAGRWDRQKRIDLVLEIARSMPDVDFHLWGEKVLHGDPITDVPANLTLEGRYASFDDLDLGKADAWLYTSAWDGVPQLLLEVAMTGIPIVASVVGGVGELLPDGEGWPVHDVDDVAAYAAALREVLADPEAARKRALRLRERLVQERSEKAYAETAAALLLKSAEPADAVGRAATSEVVGRAATSEVVGRVALPRNEEARIETATVDLTVVVTAHDETVVCGPSMQAADAAIAEARRRGHTVQPIICLDKPSAATAAYFGQDRFAHWERVTYQEGDLGRVRNAILPATQGRYVAWLDADDMFSESWLAEGVERLKAADEAGERVVVHPELNVFFDGISSVLVNIDQTSPLFTPHFFYFRNYYDSLCMAPRQTYLDHAYVSRDIPNGLSFQDFQFSIETMGSGWEHVVCRDTIIFKRRRDVSLVTESTGRRSIVRALPEMAIDRIRGLGR
ncbi:hypothetical protein GCM10027076_23730 [Nocardioides montaniterrae]